MAHKNWIEIYNYFLGHEAESYTDLSKKFGVPIGTIKYKASQEKWQEKREVLLHAARKKLEEEMTTNIVELKRQQAEFGRMLQGKAAKAMAEKHFEPKTAHQFAKWIKDGVAIERDALGMNTNTNAYAVFNTKDEFITFVTNIVVAITGGKEVKIMSSKPSKKPKDKVLPNGKSSDEKATTAAKQGE